MWTIVASIQHSWTETLTTKTKWDYHILDCVPLITLCDSPSVFTWCLLDWSKARQSKNWSSTFSFSGFTKLSVNWKRKVWLKKQGFQEMGSSFQMTKQSHHEVHLVTVLELLTASQDLPQQMALVHIRIWLKLSLWYYCRLLKICLTLLGTWFYINNFPY